jgi:hypothetical protein
MGMERVITYSGTAPSWNVIQREAAASELALVVRMIDGLPAFPDEVPEDGWKELRVGTSSGMITLRQQPGRLALVVWGNADHALQADSDQLAQACARAANGTLLPEPGASCQGH